MDANLAHVAVFTDGKYPPPITATVSLKRTKIKMLELYMLLFLRVFPVLVQSQAALLVARNLIKKERGGGQVFVVSIIWKEQVFDPLPL